MSEVSKFLAIQHGTLSDQTVRQLTDLILSGQLAPGDFLPAEPTLCKQLNVSRATVREAIRTLEARGFVQRRHGVGVQVTDRSREVAAHSISLMLQRGRSGIADLLEVRLALECQSAALAALRATEADLDVLSRSVHTMANQSTTIDEYVDADLAFHLHLAEATHNGVIVALVNAIRGLLRKSIRATYDADGRTEQRLNAHRLVLEAVARGDSNAAEAAMREHLHNTEVMLRELGLIEGDHATRVEAPAEAIVAAEESTKS